MNTSSPAVSEAPPVAGSQEPLSAPTRCVTLRLTPGQHTALRRTAHAFMLACAHAHQVGLEHHTTGNAAIHRQCYYDLRAAYGLPANLAVRAIARAARRLKAAAPAPGEVGTTLYIEYDCRVFSLCPISKTVSLASLDGRLTDIPVDAEGDVRLRLGPPMPTRAVLYMTPSQVSTLVLEYPTPHRSPQDASRQDVDA
ncbi:MAG: hypothetical protein AAF970_09740 [Bacteroidota bacterium]